MSVRRIAVEDVPTVVQMVHDLALYEKAADECHLTEEQLHESLFCESPYLFGHVAEVDGDVAGIALWFLNFSTWDGVHGIYLEDLYVDPQYRGSGLGKQLLAELAAECVRRDLSRLQWSVLNWNEPSIEFYKRIGGEHLDEWMGFRVSGQALSDLASI